MLRIDIKQIPKEYKESVTLKSYGVLPITKQKTGYGYKRFFECPYCDNRVQYLYLNVNEVARCRHCLSQRIYKQRTDIYPGGEEHLTYLMQKIASKNHINLEFPFDYVSAMFQRPKYVRHSKWEKVLRQLQTLENMRFMVIMFKGTIEPKVIKYYLNKGIYDFSLWDLKNKLIVWTYPAGFMSAEVAENTIIKSLGK